jgi:tetratricopeptide (TPR) repeat protein
LMALMAGLAGSVGAQDQPTLRRAPGSESDAPGAQTNTDAPAGRPTLKKDADGATDSAKVPDGQQQFPEEEDKSAVKKVYSFNPVQSKKDVAVGEFYFKKGDFKAAAGRFGEATKWNAGNAQAWLRLGETWEKVKDSKSAREAYEKYLEVAADATNAGEIKQRVGHCTRRREADRDARKRRPVAGI